MAEDNSESGSGFSLNLNSILALLTLVGGVWLVSHKLASDRPLATAGAAQPFPGEQTLAARLWEDPLKSDAPTDAGSDGEIETNLEALVAQIQEKGVAPNRLLFLPVMISGGQYSEDRESRIRSRYAIVSALGQSGYAPNDAEHIGALKVPWPTQRELSSFKNHEPSYSKSPKAPLANFWKTPREPRFPASAIMELRYEWYHLRPFNPPNKASTPVSNVLVLWLDDSFFDDEPLLRLPIILEPLIGADQNATVSLIGPRRSSTLLAMLPGPLSSVEPLSAAANTTLGQLATDILRRIDVFCATPSAMDEVLVLSASNHHAPREAVKTEMIKNGFKSFHNFAATDDQLAKEVFDELALSEVDLKDPKNHVVLISEWDTYYGRMQELTYAATLTARQSTNRQDSVPNLVKAWLAGTTETEVSPPNFHTYKYLRGLDGQTIGPDQESSHRDETGNSKSEHPATVDELLNWTPDANKAEGQAQFDYLSRLGDQLTELQQELARSNRGEIKAVGIVGSDVYDILLILQALRPQLPDATFFTTDLDARYLNPRDRDLTRDLLVVSGYGLTLHPDPQLQGGIPAFRESEQTAQFAAALGALGNDYLTNLDSISPRRFEIGNGVVVDWSQTNTLLYAAGRPDIWLHPLTPSEIKAHPSARTGLGITLIVVLSTLLALSLFWPPLRRLTFGAIPHCLQALDYTEEDFGGEAGIKMLVQQLRSRHDGVSVWLRDELEKSSPPENEGGKSAQTAGSGKSRGENLVALANQFIRNKDLARQLGRDGDDESQRPDPKLELWRRLKARQCLDRSLAMPGPRGQNETQEAGVGTRRAARHLFRLRRWRLATFWFLALISAGLGAALTCTIWRDTNVIPYGEPFSLVNGVSAWPGVILRLVATILAAYFMAELYFRMRGAYFSATREFQLTIPHDDESFGFKQIRDQLIFHLRPNAEVDEDSQVDALTLWKAHYENGRFWRRMLRIVLPLLFYAGVLYSIVSLKGEGLGEPLRGPAANCWNTFLIHAGAAGFLVLAFLTIDSALICRHFVFELGRRSVKYPQITRRSVLREGGNIERRFLDDWISLQLIVELTEEVGRLAYYPTGVLFILLFAHSGWWDHWTFPPTHMIIFIFNALLALASVFILQRTAKNLKTKVETRLAAEVKQLQAKTAKGRAELKATQAEQLLDEMHDLRRGAFVPFWQNPVITALFASSGGITALQLLVWLWGEK